LNPSARLATLFDIRPDERRLVGHMLLLALCLGIPGIATETADPDEYQATLEDSLDHPEELVRLDVLGRIERHEYAQLLPAVHRRLAVEPSLAVRGAAIRTLATLGDSQTATVVYPALNAAEPELRVNAAPGA